MTNVCRKLRHKTELDAVLHQQMLSPHPGNMPAFWTYQCPDCYPDWHVSLSGLHPNVLEEIAEMIRSKESEDVVFVRKLTNTKRVFDVRHRVGSFRVVYSRSKKTVEIMTEFYEKEGV